MKNEKIAYFLNVIKECVHILEEFSSISLEEYRADRKTQDIVEREFERAIHACIDVGARIISIKGLPKASTYTEIFDILMQNKLISIRIGEEIKDMVRFRNILTHEYYKIDPEIVHNKLKKLNIFFEFSNIIKNAF